MTKMVEKKRVHCSLRHVNAYVVKYDDGSFTVKCGLLKACGDSCPFKVDADYKNTFLRAPKYMPK